MKSPPQAKTHFEQVPLESVKKIIQQQLRLAGEKARPTSMLDPFDIFHKEADGGVLWRGTAETLDEARAQVRSFGASAPGDYIILCRATRTEVIIRSGVADAIIE